MSPTEDTSPKKYTHRVWTFVIAGALLVIGIVAALIYANSSMFSSGVSTGSDSTLKLVKYFPNFEYTRVRPDSVDEKNVWLLSEAGLMRLNIETKKIVDYTNVIPNLSDYNLTDAERIGDNLFIGTHSGVIQYNLVTKISKRYTTKEGLASDNNIVLTPDPGDSNVLWIGTFEGLSKLTISTGKFQNFASEIGIKGSAIEPRVFHVDEKYVWLNINANSYTNGGVARLDKSTGIWKTWDHTHFTKGDNPDESSRFDAFDADGDGERAVLEEDNVLYLYNPTKDTWNPVTVYKRSEPTAFVRELTLRGDTLYFRASDSLKKMNLETGEVVDLLSSSMFTNSDVNYELFSKSGLNSEFDEDHNRLILYSDYSPSNVRIDNGIGFFSLDTNKLSLVPFNSFADTYPVFNARIEAVQGEHIIFNQENKGLVDYNWATNTTRTLLSFGPYSPIVTKILGDKIVALNLAICDMGCGKTPNIVATTSVISLVSGKVESEATVHGTTTDAYHIGDNLDDIYLLHYDSEKTNIGYKFNPNENSLSLVDLETPRSWKPKLFYESNSSSATTTVATSDGLYSVTFSTALVAGDSIFVSVKSSESEKPLKIQVGPEVLRTPKEKPAAKIVSYVMDSVNPHVFWIGTSNGLIRLDLSTLKYQLFTKKDGLLSDSVSRIYSTDTYLIIEPSNSYSSRGVALYRFEN